MKRIKVGKTLFAFVDDADFESLNKIKWYPFTPRLTTYCQTNRGVSMHRMIMQPPKKIVVDHIDGNGLNNQRSNLRLATYSQNSINSKAKSNNKSGFKGVSYDKLLKKYRIQMIVNGKQKFLGSRKDKVEAAKAYDVFAIKYYGEFAKLNFPRRPHGIRKSNKVSV